MTTNFNTDFMEVYFTGPFRLMNLPVEIIIKILVFLDIPELINLSRTCTLLKRLANDKFISSSRFLYTKDKIGISIQNRPNIDALYMRHIIPVKSPHFNPNQMLIVSMLTKSIVKDNLKKKLERRPNLNELKEKNIVKKQDSEFVQSKIKEFKKQNLASMLSVYVNSYKFQKSTSEASHIAETEQEYTSILNKFYSNLRKITPNPLKKSKSHDHITTTIKNTATKFLNHHPNEGDNDDISNKASSSQRSVSLDSKVCSKKQYFENLQKMDDDHLIEKPKTIRKPSRTLLKASIINDCKINYEKVF